MPESETIPCENCDGSGEVIHHEKHYVDEGTRWKRLVHEEWITGECPECEGKGVERDS